MCRTVETRIEYPGPRQCGKIVLWACPTCDIVSNRCRAHSATCPECQKRICSDCTIDMYLEGAGISLCRSCGFMCVECEYLFPYAQRAVCDGPAPGVPCPSLTGVDMCNDCEFQGHCAVCDRKWCLQCDHTETCECCDTGYCTNCADELLNECDMCGDNFCMETCRGDYRETLDEVVCRRCTDKLRW